MDKINFSEKELNKFLLLGDNNTYLVDKLNPLIRVFKRNEYLAFFCTLRVKKLTTTVKLGNYPENNIEEIYAKFSVAKKIAIEGNNPNFIFKNLIVGSENYFDYTISFLLKKFVEKRIDLSRKYKKDFSNTLLKNLKPILLKPIQKFKNHELTDIINNLLIEKKIGTAKNLKNYLSTLCSFGLKQKNSPYKDHLLNILRELDQFKNKFSNTKNPIQIKTKIIIKKLKLLSEKDLFYIEKKINKFLNKNE